jgi:hypothetical protein
MRLNIAAAEYELAPLSTFDPATDFSDDPVVRQLQTHVLAESKPFIARMSIRGGEEHRLVWEVETDELDAKAAILADIETQAAAHGVRFKDLVNALAWELRLEEGQAVVLALELAFPPLLAWTRLCFVDDRPRDRGRPRALDRLTHAVWLLGEGWARATGQPVGIADRALFVRALDVAKDFLPLRRRADKNRIEQMLAFVRAEAKKIRSHDVRLVMRQNPSDDLRSPPLPAN